MNNMIKYNTWIAILGFLTLMGLGAWVYQLVNGLGVTAMNNVVSWGLYIIMFMFLVGLSAGGLIVSSSATVFDIPAYKVVAKPAIILSTVCITVAGVFIMVDLGGGVFRVYNLLIHPQFKSPLMWDVVVINSYMIINIAYLYYMTREDPPQKIMKTLSRIALPIAILVHSVTAWIFGLQIARAGWHSALMAPLFVASALDSGLALLLMTLLLMKKFTDYKIENKLITSLAGLMVTCCIVDAYFVFSEMITMYYPGEEADMIIFKEMISGSTAPFFWGEVILGFFIPIGILLFGKNREKSNLVFLSSALIFIGVLCKRIWLLLTSFIHPNVEGAPGVTTGHFSQGTYPIHMWAIKGTYFPTMIEFIIVIGMLAMGTLIFSILARNILLSSPQKKMISQETRHEVGVEVNS